MPSEIWWDSFLLWHHSLNLNVLSMTPHVYYFADAEGCSCCNCSNKQCYKCRFVGCKDVGSWWFWPISKVISLFISLSLLSVCVCFVRNNGVVILFPLYNLYLYVQNEPVSRRHQGWSIEKGWEVTKWWMGILFESLSAITPLAVFLDCLNLLT